MRSLDRGLRWETPAAMGASHRPQSLTKGIQRSRLSANDRGVHQGTLVIDTLRAAVRQADWYDPELHPRIQSSAAHYGTVFLPTRPTCGYTAQRSVRSDSTSKTWRDLRSSLCREVGFHSFTKLVARSAVMATLKWRQITIHSRTA